MYNLKENIDHLSYQIIGAAIEVHKELGAGLLESVYQTCFERELQLRDLNFRSQIEVPIVYKGNALDAKLRLDVLVEESIIVELKAVDAMNKIFEAQLLTYMKLLQKPKGILINFNCTNIFKEGQKTLVNEFYKSLK